MKPVPVEMVQNAILTAALEKIRDGRQANGAPAWDLLQLREAANQALQKAKEAEERYGKN